jgi:hypothetical protein
VATGPTVRRHEQTRNDREPSLRPARWPGRPRASTLLRAALVAVLLTVAAGILYSQEPAGCPDARTASRKGAAPPATDPGAAPPSEEPGAGRPDEEPGAGPPDEERDAPSLSIPAGLVGVPIRLAEPAALAVVQPGGRVDLLAIPAIASRGAGQPAVLARAALVLKVLAGESDTPAAILLALDPNQARRAVAQPDTTRFAVILR